MIIACPDCGTVQDLPRLRRGDIAVCPRCEARLERVSARSITASLACALSALLLLFPANLLTLLQIRFANALVQIKLASGIPQLAEQGWPLLAALVFASAIVLPFARYGLLVYALGSVSSGYRLPWRAEAFRWALLLDRWTQPEVFLVACITAYARVRAQASSSVIYVGAGGYCFLAAALMTMLARALLDRRTVWRALASMSITYFMGAPQSYRIVDGVKALFEAGLWPLGVLIACTSIGVPVAKLLGLGYCLQSIYRRSSKHLVLKTKIYRMIDESGRWSNTDPFIIAVIVPLMHFHNLVFTDAGFAATAFLLVVTITMIASRTFDTRLMWDAAAEAAHG